MNNSSKNVGIPLKLIHQAEKHQISVKLKDGKLLVGELMNSEDNWNLCLRKVIIKEKENKNCKSMLYFVRGNQITFIIIPEILKYSPLFYEIRLKMTKNIPSGLGIVGRSGAANSILKSTQWK